MTPEIAIRDGEVDTEEIDMDELSARERRIVRARNESMVVIPQTDPDGECIGIYDVRTKSGSSYTVILGPESGCDCPDVQYNGADPCKHRRRVGIEITESDCPARGQQIGKYAETLEQVEKELDHERDRILDELDTVTSMMDGIKT